jgi:ribosomal protein L11
MGSIRTIESIAKLVKTSVTTLSLPASRVNIGAAQYNTAALTLNTATVGVGGVDVAVAASSTYTVYAVVSSSSIYLVASLNSDNPSGFSQARRVGSFTTNSTSQIIEAVPENWNGYNPATNSSSGFLKPGLQGGVPSLVSNAMFKANVQNGGANLASMTLGCGTSDFNLVTMSLSYLYGNANGTLMTTAPVMTIYDADGTTLIIVSNTPVQVPVGFNGIISRSFSFIVRKPVGGNYVVKAWEQNSGGGSYSATNATFGASSQNIVF